MKSHLLVLFFSFSLFNAFSQSPYIQKYIDRDGLPSMMVYQVLQDDDGLIWVATDNGIAYFDGRRFTKVTHPKMKGQDFIGMYKAPTGRIWFWNWKGQVFYLNKNKLEYYSPNNSLDKTTISSLFSDEVGNISLIKKNPENDYFYCSAEGKCEKRKLFNEKTLSDFFSTFNKNKGNKTYSVWLNSIAALNIIRSKDSFLGILDRGVISINNRMGIGFVRYGQSHILHTLSYQDNRVKSKQLLQVDKNHVIRDYYCDNDSNIWVFTDAKLYLYNKNGLPQPINIPFVKETLINSIIQDKHGGYWMGTKGEGLLYIPNSNIVTISKENSVLNSDNIIATFTDTQKTIIATEVGEIAIVDNTSFSIKRVPYKRAIQYLYKRPDNKGFFIYATNLVNQVDNEFKDEKQFIWGTIKSMLEVNDSIHLGTTIAQKIYKDKEGNFPSFVKSTKHVPSSNSKRSYEDAYQRIIFPSEPEANSWYSILKKGNDIYWGTLNGLFKEQGRVNFSDDPILNTALVKDIKEDTVNNLLWLATNQGLHSIRNDKLVQSFTLQNGLSNNNCQNIELDKTGQLWVGTHQGVNVINPKTGQIHIIDFSNGLPSNRITSLSLNDKQAWLGTPKGSVCLNYKTIFKQKALFPVSITNIEINRKDTILLDKYTLKYKDNNCVINFVSPAFGDEVLTYHYRLVGLNSDWISTTSTTIPYTSLPSGTYQFEVYATNQEGKQSPINQEIQVEILKPFWEEWWFILIGLASAMGVVALITFLISRNYRKRREEKLNFQRELSESKIKALQAQMNPHFIFNALNAIQFFFTTNSKELAMLHLNKFAKLIRLIFEYSKETTITLQQEIRFLELYLELEKLRFNDKIAIEYSIDDQLEIDVAIPPLLIQPIIENSFKHGLLHKEGKGLLKVLFQQKTPSTIICVIEDDGIGRTAAKQYRKQWTIEGYRSSGVDTVEERIKLFNQNDSPIKIKMDIIDLEDENGIASGTKTIFTFELDEHFFE